MDSKIIQELENLGVNFSNKSKKKKGSKRELPSFKKDSKIFGVQLSDQEWINVGDYPLPKFVFMATSYLQTFTNTEIGLFRKAGNVARQKKLRLKLEKGECLKDSDNPNDVASLLKQWLRELPEPLIPAQFQELFIRCHNLADERSRASAYLLAFLLLPKDHQNTLSHLLRFLTNMALNSEKNRMGTYNLALIISPNIFSPKESKDKSKDDLLRSKTCTEIVETMIKNSDKVGEIPPSLYEQRFPVQQCPLDADFLTSVDEFDGHKSLKSKKKPRSNSVHDIFSGLRKLVGQNATPKGLNKEEFMLTSVPRHTSSLMDLGETPLLTPTNKGIFVPNEKTSSHTRRKSFGPLWLRRKEKRKDKQPFQASASLFASDSNLREKKQKFKFTLDKVDFADTSLQFNNLNLNTSVVTEEEKLQKCIKDEEVNLKPRLNSTSSEGSTVKYSKSCIWSMEKKTEGFKCPLPRERTNPSRRSLTRQDAFSIKPKKNISSPAAENIQNKNGKLNTSTVAKTLNSTCSHSRNSTMCNLKCCKNIVENRTTAIKPKQELAKEVLIDRSNQMPNSRINQTVVDKDSTKSSWSNVSPPATSLLLRNENNVRSIETPSLDVSLNLLLQNFCLSPPSKSPEIHVSIGISSPQYNPQFMVKTNQQVESSNASDVSKTRKRLSSSSDSRIPRLKKISEPIRPNSFSGNFTGCRRKIQKSDLTDKYSTQIPILEVSNYLNDDLSETAATNDCCGTVIMPMNVSGNKTQSANTSISNGDNYTNLSTTAPKHEFKVKSTSASPLRWEDGRQYLNSLPEPVDEDSPNKRASIVQILREIPGNVKSKVEMYDSNTQLASPSCSRKDSSKIYKPERSSSEKYPSGSRYNQLKLSNTNSCGSAGLKDCDKRRTNLNGLYFNSPTRFRVSEWDSAPYKKYQSFRETKESLTDNVFTDL